MDYRKEFAEFGDVIYMNTAGQAALPLVSIRAAHAAVEWKKLPHQIPDETYYELPDRVRSKLGQLIGANAKDIALTSGASSGFAAVAQGFDFRPGDEILVGQGEFPAHFAAWLGLQKAGAAQVRVVKPRDRFITADDYAAALGPRVKLVSASLVRFDNAVRLDAARLAKACHDAGAALLLDVSQCVGGIPMTAHELGADFVTSAGYKWLLGPYGTGFFWVRKDWIERLRPSPVYWAALEGAREFHNLPLENPRPVAGARRWDAPETANFFNLSALDASLDFVLRVTPHAVEEHNATILEGLIERLPRDRCVLASPREASQRGPYLCVTGRTPELTKELYGRLREEKIIVSFRQGTLRFAPYLYNTPQEIQRVISVLSV